MEGKLVSSSIVVVANDVNLSILRPPWFSKTKIFTEEELSGNIIISPVLVQITSENFEFAAFPNRFQLTLTPSNPNPQTDIERVIKGIVSVLPETPYTAIGFNFDYLVTSENRGSFYCWEQKLLASEFANTIAPDGDKEVRFGSYFSFDILGFKLKLDIKPKIAQRGIDKISNSWVPGQKLAGLHLNFHKSVSDSSKPHESIIETLSAWESISEYAKQIINNIPS